MKSERRRASRYTINQLIEMDFGKESFVRATGINISRSGLLCLTEPSLDISSRVYLSINLPTGQTVNCEGVVVRTVQQGKQHEAAISFTEFEGDDAAAFVSYIEDEESREDKD